MYSRKDLIYCLLSKFIYLIVVTYLLVYSDLGGRLGDYKLGRFLFEVIFLF